MVNIQIDKLSVTSVYVKVEFSDICEDIFVKEILTRLCIEKNIQGKPIITKWRNTGLLSKIMRKPPCFILDVKSYSYKNLLGVLKYFLHGRLYRFDTIKEYVEFVSNVEFIINYFMYEVYPKYIKNRICNFYHYNMSHNEKVSLVNKLSIQEGCDDFIKRYDFC